jgi:DNA processing protein
MTPNTEDLAYWLALYRAPGVGPATFQKLLEIFATPQQVFAASAGQLSKYGFVRANTLDYLQIPDWEAVKTDLTWAEQEHNHILTLGDRHFPALLKEIADPPPLLFVHGDPALLNQPQLAIVGSRNPSKTGKELAFEFSKYLAGTGLIITSGLALGIDGASHEGALEGGGKTIAVAGTGLDRVYPARHRDLAHRIVEHGALVSEFPPGTPADAKNFPRRNRIISGMSLGTLVVEATLKSGSLITAHLATEQGREVFAIPGSIYNPLARGCHALIRQGAKLVETAEDILEELGPLWHTQAQEVAILDTESGESSDKLDVNYRKVMDNLGFDPSPVDLIVERSGLTADAVSSILLVLELQGKVASSGGCYYRIHTKG